MELVAIGDHEEPILRVRLDRDREQTHQLDGVRGFPQRGQKVKPESAEKL
jgi:hypothetical protein